MYIDSSNEKDLMSLLAEGNEAAFEELYHLYSNRLLGYLIKIVKSDNLAGELLQDTFIKVWNSRNSIDPDKPFRPYLYRIAENNVYDFFRKVARDKKLQAQLISIASSNYSHVEESFCNKENVQLLRNVIDELPPKRRQVFRLIKIEERSYEEVSTLLNISTSTISDHIVKANKFVQERLKKWHATTIGILIFFL